MLPQQYCLRWRYHHSNLQTMFSSLLEREAFCDVTLACEGRTIKAHKIVLSACSTYFETILSQYEEKDPILIMKDVKYIDIKCLVEFMYKGEINVEHCHLATLLKTAEELRIKGLAEVSWRDDDQGPDGSNGLQTAIPQVATVMESPTGQGHGSQTPVSGHKGKKRGRPPIGNLRNDDYDSTFTTPRIMNVHGNVEETYSNDAMSSSEHEPNAWDDEHSANENDEPPMKIKKEVSHEDDLIIDERSNTSFTQSEKSASVTKSTNVTTSGSQSFLTPQIEKEWPDVIKMNEYLNTGRRQQFWEEPFTKRVMDAIKTKNLEMKVAAELLGVSYGTLYGRYRDSYGCLKHPYRVRDFWTEQGPTDVLLKLKRKEITLFRAAEQLNVTPQTLSNYLISMSALDNVDSSGGPHNQLQPHRLSDKLTVTLQGSESYEEGESEDESDAMALHSGGATTSGRNSVLANCPDITIIKKEKPDRDSKVNNNSEHSESGSDK